MPESAEIALRPDEDRATIDRAKAFLDRWEPVTVTGPAASGN